MGALHEILRGDDVVHAPGVVNTLTALLAARQGFRALHLSGAVVSATRLGLPDLGFVHAEHIAGIASEVTARVAWVPLLADADAGYGAAIQVRAAVERYVAAGVGGLHLEDQVLPKRCGHMAGKAVEPLGVAASKVRAAVEASAGRIAIVARTDALSVEGIDAAVSRAEAYVDAGADAVFVEGADIDVLAQVSARLPDVPQVVSRSEAGGDVACGPSDAALRAVGVRLVIHPVSALLAAARAVAETYAAIQRDGHAGAVTRLSWTALTDAVDLPAVLAQERDYLP